MRPGLRPFTAPDSLTRGRKRREARAPKGTAKVAVTVKLDSECVLHVEATELASKKNI